MTLAFEIIPHAASDLKISKLFTINAIDYILA